MGVLASLQGGVGAALPGSVLGEGTLGRTLGKHAPWPVFPLLPLRIITSTSLGCWVGRSELGIGQGLREVR